MHSGDRSTSSWVDCNRFAAENSENAEGAAEVCLRNDIVSSGAVPQKNLCVLLLRPLRLCGKQLVPWSRMMTIRRATPVDFSEVENLLARHDERTRLGEIVRAAIGEVSNEHIAAVSGNPPEVIAAYGMVSGTIGTACLYGVVPITKRMSEMLSFVAHDLKEHGAQQIVAEFPDTDEFKPYRDVLLESGYDPTGLVEDFYRDGVAMVIFTRKLTA